ncbi:MAG: Imm8 family immunity protein [Janthinobacterium lividum]
MKAVIRSYSCSESEDLSTYEESYPADFGFTLTFYIGVERSKGEDSFEVFVASAMYLAHRNSAQAPAFLRHTILAPDYNVPYAVALVEEYISSLEENSWEELANKINRVLRWEFEDHKMG